MRDSDQKVAARPRASSPNASDPTAMTISSTLEAAVERADAVAKRPPARRSAMSYRLITVRFPSGAVEHRYAGSVPAIGELIGRNGDSGFVTGVALDASGHVTVSVGTRVPPGITWQDASGREDGTGPDSGAREQILEAAYELFSRRGVKAVSINEVIERADVARATLYRHFRTKDDLVLAFLQRREHRWTREFVETEARRRGTTPRERLLAIFDVFDEWFQRDDFEGCSFINMLLETADPDHPVGKATTLHLEYIRSIVRTLAEEAGIEDAEAFAHSWHILMKGSIVARGEGDVLAARRAKSLARLLLDDHLPAGEISESA